MLNASNLAMYQKSETYDGKKPIKTAPFLWVISKYTNIKWKFVKKQWTTIHLFDDG